LQAKGNAAFAFGDYAKAVEHFTDAIALDPSNHVLYSNRSAAYASQGQFQQALADAERTVELKPDWPKGHSRVGAAHFGLKRWDDAAAAYQRGGCDRGLLTGGLCCCLVCCCTVPHPVWGAFRS
jgi:stress-induced-phosphoprotein 1